VELATTGTALTDPAIMDLTSMDPVTMELASTDLATTDLAITDTVTRNTDLMRVGLEGLPVPLQRIAQARRKGKRPAWTAALLGLRRSNGFTAQPQPTLRRSWPARSPPQQS
jgi:hypothetical protein